MIGWWDLAKQLSMAAGRRIVTAPDVIEAKRQLRVQAVVEAYFQGTPEEAPAQRAVALCSPRYPHRQVQAHPDLVQHGLRGWELAAYSWSLETGIATLTYQHEQTDEIRVVHRTMRAQWLSPEERARAQEMERQREEKAEARRRERKDRGLLQM